MHTTRLHSRHASTKNIILSDENVSALLRYVTSISTQETRQLPFSAKASHSAYACIPSP